jgi:hypothetical protein
VSNIPLKGIQDSSSVASSQRVVWACSRSFDLGRAEARDRLPLLIMSELQVATVRAQVALSLFTDFENFSIFKPGPHQLDSLGATLDQVIAWSGALRPIRVGA